LDDDLPEVWLFGAGHVGQALVRVCADLPLRLTWIDSRAESFPAEPPVAVSILRTLSPVQSVATAPAGVSFLVLTHSHDLDYALCRTILERDNFAWLGLIGSKSKAARFRSRLARDGLGRGSIARLVCPIGIGGIRSKWPAAIAVGVAAQLLREASADLEDFAESAESNAHHGARPEAECAAGGCSGCRQPGMGPAAPTRS